MAVYILNDLCGIFFGFFMGQFWSYDYVYKHRQYVLERDIVETQLNWKVRYNFNADKMDYYREYPLANRVEFSDAIINYDRQHPWEVEEGQQDLKDRIITVDREYQDSLDKKQQANK